MNIATVSWIVALSALLSGLALGATFELADGTVIEGEIKRQTPTSVTLTFDEGGVGTFERKDLSRETRIEVFGKGPAPGKRMWGNMAVLEKVMVGVMILGMVAMGASELWFVAAAFGVSAGWGVWVLMFGGLRNVFGALYLIGIAIWFTEVSHFPPEIAAGLIAVAACTGCCSVLFIVRHWDRAQGPVALDILGILMVAGSLLYPVLGS